MRRRVTPALEAIHAAAGSVSWFVKFRQTVGNLDPGQPFRIMRVELRGERCRVIKGCRIEMHLVRVSIGLIGHRSATRSTKQPANAGRREINRRLRTGKTAGIARHSEKCGERRRRVAPTGLAMAVATPVLWSDIFKRHRTAETSTGSCRHEPPVTKRFVVPECISYSNRVLSACGPDASFRNVRSSRRMNLLACANS